MKVVIMGGSGFIGTALSAALVLRGDTVIIPTRKITAQSAGQLIFTLWDGRSVHSLANSIQGADAVINLMGENIASARWDTTQKERILKSRVQGTLALAEAIETLHQEQRPSTLIQGSAVGYYGAMQGHLEENCCFEDKKEEPDVFGGFLSYVCSRWEAASKSVEDLGLRRVVIRSATVLDHRGGALPRLMLPFKLFMGGPLGSGNQYFSWIHLQDEVGAILHLLNSPLPGVFNLAAPEPVTMNALAATLGKILDRPSFFKVPSFIIKLAMGQLGEEVILAGQRATPKRLIESGYEFKFPTLLSALSDIVAREKAER